MSPRVSVVMPTYNRAALLAEAIESVLAQTYRDVELLVVDDGSTDGTAELLSSYGSRLRSLFLPHRGYPVPAVNAGVRAAGGEFIAFLDSDDQWLPDKLERQVALLDQQARAGFAYGNFVFVDPDGGASGPALSARQLRSGAILRDLVRNMFIHPSTLLVRRALLDEAGPFDETVERFSEHYFLLLRLARLAEAACVPEPVARIRRHAGQLSRSVEAGRSYEFAILALEQLAAAPVSWLIRLEVRRALARHHTHLARLHLQANERERARQHLHHALRSYPAHRPAWRWLLRLLRSRANSA